MRQVHRAGEKAFVDFSGKRPAIIDATTGEVVPVELFVGVLGASSYMYAEACRAQDLPLVDHRARADGRSSSAACRRSSCPTISAAASASPVATSP